MEDGAINQPSAYAQSHMVEDQGLVLHHRTEKKTPENVKEKLKEHEERVRTDLKGLVHLKMKIVTLMSFQTRKNFVHLWNTN